MSSVVLNGRALGAHGPNALRLAESELPGTGLAGPRLPLHDLDGPVLDSTGLDSTGLDGTGLDGTPPGAGLRSTGSGDTETIPLPVLIAAHGSRLHSLVLDPADEDTPDHGGAGYDLPAEPLWGDLEPGDLLGGRSSSHRAPGSWRPGRRAGGSAAQVGQPAAKQQYGYGIGRGLVVTPWFAAAAGFVVAASLWIYSPHPELTFPAIAIGKVPCTQQGCAPDTQQGSRQLTITSGSPINSSKSGGHSGSSARAGRATATSGLTFGYFVTPAAHGNFAVIISVTGKHVIKNWKLSFVLPGDHILYVGGAQWKADGGGGGVASPLSNDSGQWHGGTGGQGHGHITEPGQLLLGFTVIASGKERGPAHCRFDGAACTFHRLSIASHGSD